MAASPLITFKAGYCLASGRKVTPVQTPGYLYLYTGTRTGVAPPRFLGEGLGAYDLAG